MQFLFCFLSGENLYLSADVKNLRVSRDWDGDRWVDIEPNRNILGIISATSMDTKLSTSPKEPKSDISPISVHNVVSCHKLSAVEEDLAGMTLTNVPLKDECMNSEERAEEKEYCSNNVEQAKETIGDDLAGVDVANSSLNRNSDGDKRDEMDDSNGENNLVDCKIAEVECEAEAMEMAGNCNE